MAGEMTTTTTTTTASSERVEGSSGEGRKPVRIWVDGCFDLMHYGHANALRQAKEMGDYLVVGVHSDAEVTLNKGIPVNSEEERYAMVAACKWVDEVVRDAPYVTDVAVMDAYNCDFCVHGDDISSTADGSDSYAKVKAAGRYKECKRTPSVSTTELVGRMLLMTKTHHQAEGGHGEAEGAAIMPSEAERGRLDSFASAPDAKSPYTSIAHMLPTSRRIVQFSNGAEPRKGDRVVYLDGAFDLLHTGHLEVLRAAKAMGDFLLVGIHADHVVNQVKGCNFPILNVHERALSVLACKYVDEVIIGAPYSVTADILGGAFDVAVVVHGNSHVHPDTDGTDPYALAKERGLYREITTVNSHVTSQTIIDRIIASRQAFEERNRKKQAKELAAIAAARAAADATLPCQDEAAADCAMAAKRTKVDA